MADAKSSTGTFIFAIAVAAIGGVVAGWIGHDAMSPAPAQPPLSSMLSEPAATSVAPPTAAAVQAAQSDQVRTLEVIVGGCVADLRDYTGRLKDIANVAEAEGSSTAAEQMREFGAEIDDKLAGFDRIANQ